jgi:hypothetical protein
MGHRASGAFVQQNRQEEWSFVLENATEHGTEHRSRTHCRQCRAASCDRLQSDLEALDGHTGERTGGTVSWDSASYGDGVAGSVVEPGVRCSLGLEEGGNSYLQTGERRLIFQFPLSSDAF